VLKYKKLKYYKIFKIFKHIIFIECQRMKVINYIKKKVICNLLKKKDKNKENVIALIQNDRLNSK